VALAIENMREYEEIGRLKAQLERENIYLREEILGEHNFEEIVGSSPQLTSVLHTIDRVAPTDTTVLILGETGTGKELIARAIHSRSPRHKHPLVKVNCGAIAAGLIESELFGHVKGAFTGALDRRTGRFELADKGTIFLDEVGELPLDMQVKLLRVLQEQEFEPVGSSRTVKVDVRIIAATNRNLEQEVTAGRFRADLYYRLNVLPIRVPSLRERRTDIPQLAMFFIQRHAKRIGRTIEGVTKDSMERLTRYAWPGNVRELENVIERALVLSGSGLLDIGRDFLPAVPEMDTPAPAPAMETIAQTTPSSAPLSGTLEDVERAHILATLAQTGWVVEGPRGAAKILDMHPNTLRSRMKKLGVERSRYEISSPPRVEGT
jgi:formate hydrogenlyase transcriptional activator